MSRPFLEVFAKYQPDDAARACIDRILSYQLKVGRAEKILEAELSFSSPVSQDTLFAIERAIQDAYELNRVRIYPVYPSEYFTEEAVPALVRELMREGTVAKGFFDAFRIGSFTREQLTLEIPFDEGGLSLVDTARAPQLLTSIIEREYGVRCTVDIRSSDDYAAYFEQFEQASREQLHRMMEPAAPPEEAEAAEETLPTANTLSKEKGSVVRLGENQYRSGAVTFDWSNPTAVLGNPFSVESEEEIIPLDALTAPRRGVVAMGLLSFLDQKDTKQGDKTIFTLHLTDGVSSVAVKCILRREEAELFSQALCQKKKKIKRGTVELFLYDLALAVRGSLRQDRFDGELAITPHAVQIIGRVQRSDDAPKKRVELHCHTNMSAMDATIPPDQLIRTASHFGMPAVAVTDHGNVQAFPELMLTAEKSDVKVLYGMEAYFVDDTARAYFGEERGGFSDECVVFDLETTGLSFLTDAITDIGAVRVRDGEILDRFDTFVDPGRPIPPAITELTGITDEMVAGAPSPKEALDAFLDFAGDALLIAHNASFDISFLRRAAELSGKTVSNPYLDTVPMSRYVNPELKNHKLDTVAEYFGLGDFRHHRASDDAEMLARIYLCMTEKLRREGVHDFESLGRTMSERADPLRQKTYHQILLAKNLTGLKNLYRLVSASYLNYYRKVPRIPKTLLKQHREGLIVGSACEAGELFRAILENKTDEELKEIASFYDYLEIQPICNNRFLITEGRVPDEEALKDLNRRVVALGDELGIPVVATCDAHFLEEQEEIVRKILLTGMKFSDADRDAGLYFRTTEEMLREFDYLGEETAYRVVVENPNRIADSIERIRPIPEGKFPPKMEGAEQELQDICRSRAKDWYGDPLPELVEKRLETELGAIIRHDFAVLYMIAQRLVAYSNSLGYMVGSRGSVGSSFVATVAGISEVNPLPPHYRCKSCRYTEFVTDGSAGSGFDLPEKRCPRCGEKLYRDGHDIPFETFLGFEGDKSPDIDLNFSGDVQGKIHKYTAELFGEENVFRAGTIGTLASKTAFGYVAKYCEEHGVKLCKAETERLISSMVGIKRTTGQHPGGIIVVPREYDVYDFTPVQHPADAPDSDIVTTHFQFTYLHETILKLDELGHDMPTKLKLAEQMTGIPVSEVDTSDRNVYELFHSLKPLGIRPEDTAGIELGTLGIPEFGTGFAQQMLKDAQPKTFADLLQISGLSHGTNVWVDNAQDLIRSGEHTISDVIGTRDSIMLYLCSMGLDNATAFATMEAVRKGKGLKPEIEEKMRDHGVPDWYIDSCKKIKYLFPKAHAAAYVMQAIQFAWYKVYRPLEFYAAYFTAAPDGFDGEIVLRGRGGITRFLDEVKRAGNDASQRDQDVADALKLVLESIARGVRYLKPDLYRSDAKAFLPEDGAIRLPFSVFPGLGVSAAEKIVRARADGEFFSRSELQERAQLSKSVMEVLASAGVLDGMNETNQLTLF